MIEESSTLPPEEEFCRVYRYRTTGDSTVAALWVDAMGGVWLESNDGQKVVVPAEVRKLLAKRLRDATFR